MPGVCEITVMDDHDVGRCLVDWDRHQFRRAPSRRPWPTLNNGSEAMRVPRRYHSGLTGLTEE